VPYGGDISIVSSVTDGNYNAAFDGVKVRVLKNSSTLIDWKHSPEASPGTVYTDMSTTSTVEQGDVIYFQMNHNSIYGYDLTKWDPVIYYTSVVETSGQTTLADHDGDGIVDIFEDIDGDGIVDSGETDWKQSENNLSSSGNVVVFTVLE